MSKFGRVGSCVVGFVFVFSIASGLNEASARGGFGGHGGSGGFRAGGGGGHFGGASFRGMGGGGLRSGMGGFNRNFADDHFRDFARRGNFTRPGVWFHEISHA